MSNKEQLVNRIDRAMMAFEEELSERLATISDELDCEIVDFLDVRAVMEAKERRLTQEFERAEKRNYL